ncbi:hypothetical protein GWK47_037324 [Chionoecetes opilio]|uniref:Uncharacterized protein n=1 Tax=Chionoecetes opilio TaxID=41210 RepID=A0A8J4YF02_CHIOP|nr:hypothetical protein GWK47_037324 [Chionoecetes opilio]
MTGGVCMRGEAQQKAAPSSALASQALRQVRAPSCILVNLDAVRHNVQVLRGLAGPNTAQSNCETVLDCGSQGERRKSVQSMEVDKAHPTSMASWCGEGQRVWLGSAPRGEVLLEEGWRSCLWPRWRRGVYPRRQGVTRPITVLGGCQL